MTYNIYIYDIIYTIYLHQHLTICAISATETNTSKLSATVKARSPAPLPISSSSLEPALSSVACASGRGAWSSRTTPRTSYVTSSYVTSSYTYVTSSSSPRTTPRTSICVCVNVSAAAMRTRAFMIEFVAALTAGSRRVMLKITSRTRACPAAVKASRRRPGTVSSTDIAGGGEKLSGSIQSASDALPSL